MLLQTLVIDSQYQIERGFRKFNESIDGGRSTFPKSIFNQRFSEALRTPESKIRKKASWIKNPREKLSFNPRDERKAEKLKSVKFQSNRYALKATMKAGAEGNILKVGDKVFWKIF